jgi:ubiquinone/menaquinone biosynthesis C-methylase UbiE
LRSTMLLGHLFLKTRIDRRTFLYAEPFATSGEVDSTPAQREWDAYWLEKKKPAALIYDLIAAFYRRFVIKPSLNHFAGKHFRPGAEVLHAGCGGGQVDTDIAQTLRISALDISGQALSMYRKCQPRSERLMHGSIFQIAVPESSFDGVYNLGVMEHFTKTEIHRILEEFNRVLKPGGKIVLFWPPSFGLTVRVLAAIHWLLRIIGKTGIKLHPDEITHVRSRRQVRALLEAAGFSLLHFHFGFRDLFTQVVVVGQKGYGTQQAHTTDIAIEASGAKFVPVCIETGARG